MGLSRRMFTKEFKLAAVERLEHGSTIGEVARALEVNPNVLDRWRRGFGRAGTCFRVMASSAGQTGGSPSRTQDRPTGLEIDFLKGCWQRIEEQRMLQALTGNPPSTKRSKNK